MHSFDKCAKWALQCIGWSCDSSVTQLYKCYISGKQTLKAIQKPFHPTLGLPCCPEKWGNIYYYSILFK